MKPFALFFALSLLLLSSCGGKTAVITADMAREGVSNYCHSNYDWSPAREHPDLMYVTLGDETDSTFQVIFRSYTGSFEDDGIRPRAGHRAGCRHHRAARLAEVKKARL